MRKVGVPASATVVASRYDHYVRHATMSVVATLQRPDLERWMAALARSQDWSSGPDYDRDAVNRARADPLLSQCADVWNDERAFGFRMQSPEGGGEHTLGNSRYVVAFPADGLVLLIAE